MKNLPTKFLAIVLTCFGFSRAATAADHAQATAVADVSAIAAGTSFTIGIKFAIDPGWHIYWKNPGDSGMATSIKLTLPEGFKADELLFPVPSRFEFAGPIVNYGYAKETMLMVRVTPPKELPPGKSTSIPIKATWLVCDENNCVPGGTDLSVELSGADTAAPANADLFKSWNSKLPVKEDAADIATTSNMLALENGTGEATITIGWKKVPADLFYIPGPLNSGDVQNVKLTTEGDSTKITFTIKNFKAGEPVTGLLTFTSATGEKIGVETSIPTAATKN